jgi:capsid protein
MWPAIRRVLGLDRRAFDAAGGGRRWEGSKRVESLNAAILAGATVAARRAGYYARNNPWVVAAVQALIANAVGTGIKPRSTHPDSNVRDALHRLWARWTDCADVCGLTDFYGLQALALRAWSRAASRLSGYVQQTPAKVCRRCRSNCSTASRCRPTLHREIGNGARVRAGIEFDAAGRRIAYHCYRNRPGDALAPRQPARMDTAASIAFWSPGRMCSSTEILRRPARSSRDRASCRAPCCTAAHGLR